jgi:hypothetical protein
VFLKRRNDFHKIGVGVGVGVREKYGPVVEGPYQ